MSSTSTLIVYPQEAYASNFTNKFKMCPIVDYQIMQRNEINKIVPYIGNVINIRQSDMALVVNIKTAVKLTKFYL